MKMRLKLLTLLVLSGMYAHAQVNWTNVGNGLQQRTVLGTIEYRFVKTPQYPGFFSVSDSLSLKAPISGGSGYIRNLQSFTTPQLGNYSFNGIGYIGDGTIDFSTYNSPSGSTVSTLSKSIVAVTTNPTNNVNNHSFSDNSNFYTTINGVAHNSFDYRINITGTGNNDHTAGFQDAPVYSSTGTQSDMWGLYSRPTVNSGTITRRVGAYIGDIAGSGGTIGTNTAIEIAPLVRGTTLFAINNKSVAPIQSAGDLNLINSSAVAGTGMNIRYIAGSATRVALITSDFQSSTAGNLHFKVRTASGSTDASATEVFGLYGGASPYSLFTGGVRFPSAGFLLSNGTGSNSTYVGSTGTGSVVLSASPALTGVPTAPTAVGGTNTTQLATTAFVQSAIGGSGFVPTSRTITAGNGLTGGGDLSANRTLSADTTVIRSVANSLSLVQAQTKDAQNVKLTGSQNISGTKTFSGGIIFAGATNIFRNNGFDITVAPPPTTLGNFTQFYQNKSGDIALTNDTTIFRSVNNSLSLSQLQTKLNSYALDANVVHKTGDETINDVKTFTSSVYGGDFFTNRYVGGRAYFLNIYATEQESSSNSVNRLYGIPNDAYGASINGLRYKAASGLSGGLANITTDFVINSTASRRIDFQDKDGTIALTSDIAAYATSLTTTDMSVTPYTKATLNSTYPSAPIRYEVVCPNQGMVYRKYDATNWYATNVTYLP